MPFPLGDGARIPCPLPDSEDPTRMLRTLLAVLSAVLLLIAAPLLAALVTLGAADATAPSFALWAWGLTGVAALIGMVVFGLAVGRVARAHPAAVTEPVDADATLDVPVSPASPDPFRSGSARRR